MARPKRPGLWFGVLIATSVAVAVAAAALYAVAQSAS